MRRWARLGLGILMAIAWFAAQAVLSPAVGQEALPPLQAHPLPPSLERIQTHQQDDYFEAIAPTTVGYLVWSQFPVSVYVEPPSQAVGDRSVEWVDAVHRAIAEWSAYLPLEVTPAADAADITIWRRNPPLRYQNGAVRARSAETRYELYTRRVNGTPTLSQRQTVWLRPAQSQQYLQAAARHELGHALGIWGHSPLESDALYAAQVRHPAPISERDLNTLKRVYQQPTRLGWPLLLSGQS